MQHIDLNQYLATDYLLCNVGRSFKMRYNVIVIIIMLIMSALLIVINQQASVLAILKFNVPKHGVLVPAGQPLTVTGTSMASNSTATNCNVQLQTNQNGYIPTTPMGPPGPNKYVNWTGQSEPLQPGHNEIEAQLMCFDPGINPAAPNHPSILKHLVPEHRKAYSRLCMTLFEFQVFFAKLNHCWLLILISITVRNKHLRIIMPLHDIAKLIEIPTIH